MVNSYPNHSLGTTWEEILAPFGIKRDDQFFRNDAVVIDGECAQVDGRQGGNGGNADEICNRGEVNDPERGLVIRGPWSEREDQSASEEQGAAEASASGPDHPPPGWVLNKKGVFDDRQHRMEWICGPLLVTHTIVTNGVFGRVLVFRNKLGKIGTWIINEDELQKASQGLAQELARQGLAIRPRQGKNLVEYVGACHPSKQCEGISELGWHHNSDNDLIYALPEQVILPPQRNLYMRWMPHGSGMTASEDDHPKGSFADWQQRVSTPACQIKAGILMLSAGFASALLKFAPETINFILNFYGKSTKGKSTALVLAASIWGNPDRYIQSWNITELAMLDLAGNYRDRPMIMDELGEGTHKDTQIVSMLYRIASGQGRTRSSATGSVTKNKRFRTIVLSSAEYSLAQAMRNTGKIPPDGAVHRGLDIEIIDAAAELPEAHRENFIKKLTGDCKRYYGTAGTAFVQCLVDEFRDGNDLKEYLRDRGKSILADFGLPSTDILLKRGLERFVLLTVAGELAARYGIMRTSGSFVREAIRGYAKAWHQSHSLASKQNNLIEDIASFIFKNERRFQKKGHTAPANCVGWIVHIKQNRFYAFHKDGLKEAANQMADIEQIAKLLQEKGFLFQNDPKKFVSKVPVDLPNARRWAYAVKDTILERGPDEN
jgi:putative DNA primase/helicase